MRSGSSAHSHHRHASPRPMPELADELRRKSRKVTAARQAILEALRRQPHPVSARDLHALLPRGESDLATVYRSLHLLENLGLVKRFDLGDGVARFELLGAGDDGHHHHLVCTQCASVVELEECAMHEVEAEIAARNGFSSVTHRLEFFGICPGCRPA